MTVKKILAYISSSFCLLIVSMLTSCGLIDMEFDEDIQGAYDMQLDHDTVYVTQGEHFVLQPVFTPDSVSNREVFFRSANEEIAYIKNDTIYAESIGETVISATSVMNEKMAFCHVFVLKPWEIDIYRYSDDMVAYVTASVDDVPLDFEKQMVVAFVGGELRGIGKLIELNDTRVVQIRIYGHLDYDSEWETFPELVYFAYYDREKLMLNQLPIYLKFDGETHGSVSEPIKLTSYQND